MLTCRYMLLSQVHFQSWKKFIAMINVLRFAIHWVTLKFKQLEVDRYHYHSDGKINVVSCETLLKNDMNALNLLCSNGISRTEDSSSIYEQGNML